MASAHSSPPPLRPSIPPPLTLCRPTQTSRLPHLIQPLDANNEFELDALVSSIKHTVVANEILAKPWSISENGELVQVQRESDDPIDVVHVVPKPETDSSLDALIDRITLGEVNLLESRTNFYIIADADATPSHLILVNGALFVNRVSVLQVLGEIQGHYIQKPVEHKGSLDDALRLREEGEALGASESAPYWRALLADFNKLPIGETTTQPCITSLVSSTVKLPAHCDSSFETLRLTVLAAWVAVLSKHVGSEDVLIGEALSNLSSASAISPTVPLIPRRVKLANPKSYMDQLASQITGEDAHASYALRATLDTLERDPFYSVVEISKQVESTLFPASYQKLFRPYNTSLYLAVTVATAGDQVELSLGYDSNAFHEGDAKYMLSHLVHGTEQLCETPGLAHSKIEMMNTEERNFVMHLPTIMERDGVSLPEDHDTFRYAPDLLSRSLAASPDAMAIEWEGKPLYTYAQLEAASNKLSRYLTDELSVHPRDVVVLFSDNSPFVVVAIYAILKAGAAYLPLDVEMPDDRFRHVIKMVDAKLVLTVKKMEEKLVKLCEGRKVAPVDEAAPHWEALDGSSPARPSEDPATLLAYVNLTSGTTGLPKGCMITHTNLVRWAVESEPCYKFEPGIRRLQFCKLQFDGFVEEIFMTHLVGGSLCMSSTLTMEKSLHDVINSMKITHLTLTPTLTMLFDPSTLPTVKVLTVTGEPLRRFARERWLQHGITLQNGYGPTETVCGFALENPVRSSPSNETPVGFALGTTRIYILDPELQPTPVGCMGEICISGPTVGLGYFGDVEKSKPVYVRDPFRDDFRMYRTGDLGRVNYEGRLSFLGRRDHQIKIHGNRIELSEIESVLSLSGSTWKNAADVVTFQDGPRIAAFIAPQLAVGGQETELTLTEEAKIEALRLTEFAKTKLLRQMVPSIWIPMNALPRTVSGKLNRKVIKDFFHGLSFEDKGAIADFLSERREIVPPSTVLEITLHRMWSECLNIAPERIGIHDSFYSLGADSLSNVRLAAAHKKAGFDISPVDLKKQKTIANVAELLSQRISPVEAREDGPSMSLLHQTALDLAEHGIPFASVEDVIPATPFQRGVLLQPETSERNYMTAMSFIIDKQIDPKRFSNAFEILLMAHPVLRTAFMLSKEHSIVQVLLSEPPRVFTLFADSEDGSSTVSEQAIAKNESSIAKLFSKHNWGSTPLHPILLYNSKGPSELLCFIHHALYDGWSIRLLVNDLINLYDGNPIPARPSWQEFVKFACTTQESSSKFWKSYLENIQYPTFCKPGLLSSESRMAETRKEFKLDMTNTSKALQVMDSVLMYAAWALVQYIHSGDEDIVFGIISSGRDAPVSGILDMVGPCVAYFPLRIDFSKLKTIRDLVHAVENAMAAVHEHEHFGTSAILKNAGHTRHVSNVDFVLQNLDVSTEFSQAKPWIYARRNTVPEAGRALTIDVQYQRDRSGFQIGAVYDTSAVQDQEIDYMLGRFGEIVRLSLANPDMELVVGQFMIPGEEEQVVLRDEIHVPSETQSSTLEHFLRNVESQPSDLAIDTDGGVQITYSELDAVSTIFSKKLGTLGVGVGDMVLIHLEKRPELIFAVLGCFKAGVCFSTASTDYPLDRLKTVAQDLKPALIISSTTISQLGVPTWNPSNLRFEEEETAVNLPSNSLDGSSLAYVVMTSGTTGAPKPIGISRGNLDAFINGCGPDYHRRQRRCLFFASINYDASLLDIFGTLCFGGCICLASDSALREDLPGAMRRMRVEVAHLVPTVARLLVDERFDTLKVLTIGGESFTSDLRDRLLSTGISELQTAYGPAECTIECFRHSVSPQTVGSQMVSLGKPFGETIAVVVDSELRPVPFGAVGELCIGGPQVSSGYLRRPEVNAQAFADINVAHGKKMSVYRSGDIVRLLPNRTLVFVRRKDRQVKVRGVRVEPGEVESSIRAAVPGVSQVAVAPIKNSTGALDLAAFVVMAAYAILDVASALEAVRARALVPPTKLIVVPRLPFTISGKLDMQRLQGLYEEALNADRAVHSPREIQIQTQVLPAAKSSSAQIVFVRKIWATVLNIQDDVIDLDAPFQELGGDSLKWMQLSMHFLRAKQKISLSALMAANSVRRQADLVK